MYTIRGAIYTLAMLRAAPLLIFLSWVPFVGAQTPESHGPQKPFLISVDQPAFVGEPIWVNEKTRPTPYSYVGGECNRLELLYDGKPVPPWPVKPAFVGGGSAGPVSVNLDCHRSALYNPSPGKRLPLHIWFHIQQPGRYAVRWSYEWPTFESDKNLTKRVSSPWITFTVQQTRTEDREKWLRSLLAQPDQSSVDLLSRYIPSLVAAAPDERALHAMAARLTSFDRAAAMAADALAFFPQDRVKAAIYQLIQKQGPTDLLAHLVAQDSFGLNDDANQRNQMARACFGYLHSSDPEKIAAALEMILFDVHAKIPTPADPGLVEQADDEVLNAAADIAGTGRENPQRELILYMRGITNPEKRRQLIAMAHSAGPASDIANTALIFDHAPEAIGPLLLEAKEYSDVPHEFKTTSSHGITITNVSNGSISIERGIAIEKKTPQGWTQQTDIQAVAACKDRRYESKSPLRLAPHGSLAAYPWDGFQCGGQCEDACQQNAYLGPGIFRFVVALPDRKKIASLPFAISGP
ncbi:MAG TPA: hypothetical protein VKR52_12185 [Terracidiphilus sp.]|nr:hypothetical protein [Terracidiphilus sp.]